MSLDARDFALISKVVKEDSGLVLTDGRRVFVESRLKRVAAERGVETVSALCRSLRRESRGETRRIVVEALTNNETSFFRDGHPFDVLRDSVFAELEANVVGPLQIWSAASSSGQEAYSVAMLLWERYGDEAPVKGRVYASDLSREMVERVRAGRYSELELKRGLSEARRAEFFDDESEGAVVKGSLRRMVEVRVFNLLDEWSWQPRGLHIILLRNILIYFAPDLREQILAQAMKALVPGGFLVLGASETTIASAQPFELRRFGRTVMYQTPGALEGRR